MSSNATNDTASVNALVRKLTDLANTQPSRKRIVRNTPYNFQGHEIVSWKFNEFLYKKSPCPFPTLARGLFTAKSQKNKNENIILLRGYDKFFNIGETKKTSWDSISEDTQGPYELTVKENGCLILVSALDRDSLIVTSKHAINIPHSQVGTEWLMKHLEKSNKSEKELASILFENNATAIFELCDDNFEEHILEYSPQKSGLYLHGVNYNTVELDTWPSQKVTELAKEFGFHETNYYVFDNMDDAKEFSDKIRDEHSLKGRAIEGFVVRCRETLSHKPFMFKIKYDEPYLMYREWREITKLILNGKPYKCRYKLTHAYAKWIKADINRNREDYAKYQENKGIISARNKFLEYYKSMGGDVKDVLESLPQDEKVLLVPIATIACGKTTLSIALSELFKFGHIQNDNITAKKRARDVFHKSIIDDFEKKPVVIADRNNHIGMLRETLSTAIKDQYPNCKIVALYWNHDNVSTDRMLKTAIERVRGRGEKHQSLTPGRNPSFDKVLLRFLQDFEPLDQDSSSDNLIDDFIELDPLGTIEDNLQIVIKSLFNMFPKLFEGQEMPSKAEIARAVTLAKRYTPTVQKNVSEDKRKVKKGPPVYYGLSLDFDFSEWLETNLSDGQKYQDKDLSLYKHLKEENLMPDSHHITLAHEIAAKTKPKHQKLYDEFTSIWNKLNGSARSTLCPVTCHADYLVWDKDSLAIRVNSIKVDPDFLSTKISTDSNGKSIDAKTLLGPVTKQDKNENTLLDCGNAIAHVTLGYRKEIKAMQTNALLEKVFGQDNSDTPILSSQSQDEPEWHAIPVDLVFNCKLQKFVGSSNN